MKKKMFKNLLCSMLVAGSVLTMMPNTNVFANEYTQVSAEDEGNPASNPTDIAEMSEGTAGDIIINNYSVSGGKAGETATINFTATINSNVTSKKYTVDQIKRVFANIDENAPFETNDEADRITVVNGNTINVSYSFTVKDNIDTAYYPVSFTVVYGKKALPVITDAEAKKEIEVPEYYITKNFSVKLTAKPEEKKEEKKEAEAADTDIAFEVKNSVTGVYGQKCKLNFTVKSSSCKITNVAPVISDNFPFETKGDAYKNISSKGAAGIKCEYDFTVRSDVTTGYHGVTFAITYLKDGKSFTTNKSMNVKFEGKKEKSESSAGTEAKTSTPRLMVTGCETNLDQIYPNDVFVLTVHLKNTAKKTVSNIKVTLVSEEKNFISTNGASSAYVESIGAGETSDVTFELQADSSLSAKAYGITVKTEYEDTAANPFTSEDSLTIPVTLKSDMKITDVQIPYDFYVGSEGSLSFTITNTGASTLYNVNVKCESEDFTCEETYVGNIAAGGTGYASITLTGTKQTEGDGICTIKVTYEDNKGNATTVEEPTNIFVYDMGAAGEETYEEEIVEPEKKTVIWPYFVGAIAVAGIVAFVVIRGKKKRKQAEEELMDDDI